ncbi:hypothetical protein [Clostridium sp.]|uniref:hypothetical protein n=1 Tax=Clostridium sp. TaxID=1506 RepID=UPI00258BD221|nr:hypothetical protein [Clostridium sp.]
MIDDKLEKAFAVANNVIYFDDSSDYGTALYEICQILKPEIDAYDIGKKYIEE